MDRMRYFLAFVYMFAYCESSVLNAILDYALESNRAELVKAGNTSAAIGDLEHDFEISLRFLNVSGDLTCMQGWVKDFSTLLRIGDVSCRLGEEGFVVSADLLLGKLQLGFRHCRLRVPPLAGSLSGQLSMTVRHHQIQARASLSLDKQRHCSPQLEALTLGGVEQVVIDSTDGLFNMIINEIDSAIVRKALDDATDVIMARLEQVVKGALLSLAFCPSAATPSTLT